MTGLLYLAGLIIGFAVFMYLFSLYQSGKEKVQEWGEKKNGVSKEMVEPDTITLKEKLTRAPGTRICPLCDSALTKYESLYATIQEDEGVKKILIHGCRYCYKPEENPDQEKKSAL